jgi:hypothetical protein
VRNTDTLTVYAPEIGETYILPISEAPETSMGLCVEDANNPSPNINWTSEFPTGKWQP